MLNLLHVHGHLANSVHCMVSILHCESLAHIYTLEVCMWEGREWAS